MNRFSLVLCFLAAFPREAFSLLATPSDRVSVYVRGLAVILSPTVFTLALTYNASLIFGTAPYIYLLPVAVFCLDWLLMARGYAPDRGAVSLVLLRIGVLLVSVLLAVFAGLLAETDNLVQKLYAVEDAATLNSGAAQDIIARRSAVAERLERNDIALIERPELKREALESARLYQLECAGPRGIDPRTGVLIKGGGKCGERAFAHQTTAQALEARLAQLEEIEVENEDLVQQYQAYDDQLNAVVRANRSPETSIGTLLQALDEADLGLWISVFGRAVIIVLMEALALILAECGVSPALRIAVENSTEVDQQRLQLWRHAQIAELARERVVKRTQASDGLVPLEVQLSAVAPASSAAPPHAVAEVAQEHS